MKIGIFSDLHLRKGGKKVEGVWDKKLIDGLSVLEQVCDIFNKEKIDIFVFCGDFFEQRYYLDVQIVHGAVEIINKLPENILGYFIVGNHDMYMRSEVNSLFLYGLRWKVIDTLTTLMEHGEQMVCIPYQKSFSDNDYDKINGICKNKIIFMHQILQGFSYQSGYTPKDDEVFNYNRISGYKKIFSGHNHISKIKDSVIQIGSVMQLNFGDEKGKRGCWTYETETDKLDFYELDYPKYISLDEIPMKLDDNNYYRLKIKESEFSKTLSIPDNVEVQVIPEEETLNRLELGETWDWEEVVKKYVNLKEKSSEYIDVGIEMMKGVQ